MTLTQIEPARSRFAARLKLADVTIALGAIIGALAVGAIVIALAGLDPLHAYASLFKGAFGSVRSFSETLVRFCPLALSALAVLVGFRAGFFTIGVEGQLYMGALATTATALFLPGLPPVVLIPLAMAAAIVAGALWALLAGYLKVRFGVNEVIGTIMLNYIAVLFVDYMLRGPLRAPDSELHYTDIISQNAWLPVLMDKSRLHLGVFIPVIAAILVYLFLWRMPSGFKVRVSGMSMGAARHSGIDPKRSILIAVAVSGALAGLAGAVEIQGVFHRLQAGIASDFGYTAIPIALVGKTIPSATLLASLFFAALGVGATMMQLKASVPLPVVVLIQGLIILAVVGSEAFKPRLIRLFSRKSAG